MKFSELQKLVENKLGIKHLADIARELGVTPQAVSNWKSRDSVPYKYVVKIRKQLDSSIPDIVSKDTEYRKNNDQRLNKYQNTTNYEEYNFSITDIFLVIASHLKIIILTPFIFFIITYINIKFFTDAVYISSAKIMSSSSSNTSQFNGLATAFGITTPSNTDGQWVYPEIIKSRTIARAMLNRKFDTIKYGPQKSLLQILTYGKGKPSNNIENEIKSGVDEVIGMIDVYMEGSFYNLNITAPEPNFARDFALALLEELDSHQREYNLSKTGETRGFIEERIKETEKELNSAEEALKNFRASNRRIENSPGLLLEQERLSREVAVLIGVFTTLKQQLETAKIDIVKDSDYVVVLDPPEAPISPAGPGKRGKLIIASILGIFVGIFFSFIKEYLENSNSEEQKKINKMKRLIINNIKDFSPIRLIKK